MLTLYFTRHGETKWNVEKRMQGWLDSELTENGRSAAISLGKRLESVDINKIYSSPSPRAYTTAQLIAGQRPIPLTKVEHLREINMGDWEGETQESIMEADGDRFSSFWNEPHLYTPVRGETFQEVQNRTVEAVKEIILENPSGNVLVVSHAVVIKTLYAHFKKLPIKNLWDPPFIHGTSLTVIVFEGGRHKFLLEADTGHIEYSSK